MSPGARRGSRAQMWNKAKHAQKSNRAKHAQRSNRAQHAQRSSSSTEDEALKDNLLNALSQLPGGAGKIFTAFCKLRSAAKSAGKTRKDYDSVIHALDTLIAQPRPDTFQDFVVAIANLYNLDGFQKNELYKSTSVYQDDVVAGIKEAKRLRRLRRKSK